MRDLENGGKIALGGVSGKENAKKIEEMLDKEVNSFGSDIKKEFENMPDLSTKNSLHISGADNDVSDKYYEGNLFGNKIKKKERMISLNGSLFGSNLQRSKENFDNYLKSKNNEQGINKVVGESKIFGKNNEKGGKGI